MSDFWQVQGGERTSERVPAEGARVFCFGSLTRVWERARESLSFDLTASQLEFEAVKEEKHIHREPSSPSPPPLANQETPEKKLCLVSKREPGSGSGASTSLSTPA